MTEANKESENKTQNQSQPKEQKINISLDTSPQVRELNEELKRIREEASRKEQEAAKKFEKLEEERLAAIKAVESDKQAVLKEKELLAQEKDDYKTKLELIEEKEFLESKKLILERAKKDFGGNDTKYKELEAKLSDPQKGPEEVKRAEFMLSTMEEVFESQRKATEKAIEDTRKAEEARITAERKNAPAPPTTGGDTAQLPSSQPPVAQNTPSENGTYNAGYGFTPTENLIRDLYVKSNSNNPNVQERAAAEATIKQLLKKVQTEFHDNFNNHKPVAPEMSESKTEDKLGFSPYKKADEIKTFKEMKKSGI
jgi:hypothetical protein